MEKRTVLFIDDEEELLRIIEKVLQDEPYQMLFATRGKEAFEVLQQNEVHVIVVDMRMPEMSGLDFLKVIKEKYPPIVRMVLSGHAQVTSLLTAINEREIFKYRTRGNDGKKKKDKWVKIKCYFTALKNVNEAFQQLYGIQ